MQTNYYYAIFLLKISSFPGIFAKIFLLYICGCILNPRKTCCFDYTYKTLAYKIAKLSSIPKGKQKYIEQLSFTTSAATLICRLVETCDYKRYINFTILMDSWQYKVSSTP